MNIEQIYTGCLAQGAYYIESNGEVAIIDPLRETEPYLSRANKDGAKIKYIFEGAIGITLVNNGLSGRFSRSLDGSQTKADFALLVYHKINPGFIYMRAQHGNVDVSALLHKEAHLVAVGQVVGEEGSHKFRRVVGF